MPTAPAAEPPVIETTLPESHLETSRNIFKQARIDAGLDQQPEPPAPEPAPAPEPTAPAGDTPAPAKSLIPDDVIDPGKAAVAEVHPAIAELDAMVLPKNAKPEQVANFSQQKGTFKKHLQTALDRTAELEKQISKATSTADLEELRGKLKAAEEKAQAIEEEWSKVAFQESPRFKAQFAAREQTSLELAKTYLDGTNVKEDIIDLAARATGRKRVEILKDAGIDDAAITAIMPHLANFDTVQREKQQAVSNWKTESKQWHEAETARQTADRQKRTDAENKVWEQVLARTDILPLRKSKENQEWNGRAEQLVAEAKKIFNGEGADLPTFAERIIKGCAYDAQQEVVDHLRGKVENLLAENAKLKSAAPGGTINAGTHDGAGVDTTKMTREEQAKNTFNAEKAKVGAA